MFVTQAVTAALASTTSTAALTAATRTAILAGSAALSPQDVSVRFGKNPFVGVLDQGGQALRPILVPLSCRGLDQRGTSQSSDHREESDHRKESNHTRESECREQRAVVSQEQGAQCAWPSNSYPWFEPPL